MEKEERTAEAAGYEGEITAENLWSVIVSLQGKVFYTSKKLPFTYTVRIKGPKKLNVYGAPYVWAILKTVGAVPSEKEEPKGQG